MKMIISSQNIIIKADNRDRKRKQKGQAKCRKPNIKQKRKLIDSCKTTMDSGNGNNDIINKSQNRNDYEI